MHPSQFKVFFLHMPGMPAYWPVLRKLAWSDKKVVPQEKLCPEGPKIAKIHWILACPVLILSKKSFFQQKVAFFDKNGPFREEKWPTQRTKMACAEGKNGLSKTSYARGGLCMCRKKPLPGPLLQRSRIIGRNLLASLAVWPTPTKNPGYGPASDYTQHT